MEDDEAINVKMYDFRVCDTYMNDWMSVTRDRNSAAAKA